MFAYIYSTCLTLHHRVRSSTEYEVEVVVNMECVCHAGMLLCVRMLLCICTAGRNIHKFVELLILVIGLFNTCNFNVMDTTLKRKV